MTECYHTKSSVVASRTVDMHGDEQDLANARFGSTADKPRSESVVGFEPVSRHRTCTSVTTQATSGAIDIEGERQ